MQSISERLLLQPPGLVGYYQEYIKILNLVSHPLDLVFFEDIMNYTGDVYSLRYGTYTIKSEKIFIYYVSNSGSIRTIRNPEDISCIKCVQCMRTQIQYHFISVTEDYPSGLLLTDVLSTKQFSNDDRIILDKACDDSIRLSL